MHIFKKNENKTRYNITRLPQSFTLLFLMWERNNVRTYILFTWLLLSLIFSVETWELLWYSHQSLGKKTKCFSQNFELFLLMSTYTIVTVLANLQSFLTPHTQQFFSHELLIALHLLAKNCLFLVTINIWKGNLVKLITSEKLDLIASLSQNFSGCMSCTSGWKKYEALNPSETSKNFTVT